MSILLVLPVALALDLDTFRPAGSSSDSQGGLQVFSPSIGWDGSGYAGLGLVYASNPIVRAFEDGSQEVVVGSAFATRFGAGYNVGGRVRLDLDLPIYPFVGGEAYSGFSTGDARVSATIPLLARGEKPLGVALVPIVALPTGQPDRLTGNGFGAGLAVAAGYAPTEKVFVDANLGVLGTGAQTQLEDITLGSNLGVGVGAGYRLNERFTLGAEIDAQITVADGLAPYNSNPTELHVYGTYGTGAGLVATLGLGTGLVAGVGAPDLRVVGQLAYRIPGTAPVYDIDSDGIVDANDACGDAPEDADGWLDGDGCPEFDNDEDGVADASDTCPNDAEDADGWDDTDGCPEADNDRDGLVDTLDACPSQAGPDATVGCPDQDGDKVADRVDACPTEPGAERAKGCPDTDEDLVANFRDKCPTQPKDPREDPERSDGCPKRVFVSLERVEILDKIYFDANRTSIRSISFPLLQEIAATLNANPDLLRVEVAGHTDSDGADDKNLALSQGRAEAVAAWLSAKGGVAAERLVAVGYGETKPVDTNATSVGKANNRRVEFVIQATRPASQGAGP